MVFEIDDGTNAAALPFSARALPCLTCCCCGLGLTASPLGRVACDVDTIWGCPRLAWGCPGALGFAALYTVPEADAMPLLRPLPLPCLEGRKAAAAAPLAAATGSDLPWPLVPGAEGTCWGCMPARLTALPGALLPAESVPELPTTPVALKPPEREESL